MVLGSALCIVFMQKYQQKLYILKIEVVLINTDDFVGQEKCAKMFQMLQLKKTAHF